MVSQLSRYLAAKQVLFYIGCMCLRNRTVGGTNPILGNGELAASWRQVGGKFMPFNIAMDTGTLCRST